MNGFHIQTYLEGRESGLPPMLIPLTGGEFSEQEWFVVSEPPERLEELYSFSVEVQSEDPLRIYAAHTIRELDDLKALTKKKITSAYEEFLNSGFTLPSGLTVTTDAEDRAIIRGLLTRLSLDTELQEINYKVGSGFVTLTREEALQFAQAVISFEKACLDKLSVLIETIEGCSTQNEIIPIYTGGFSL